ncbi:hypothetical protein MNBD_UNCLBAC01-1071, partial [hydrothermal vent metagenome]
SFTFHSPKTLSEALKLYAQLDNVKIIAGGTFLINSLKLLKKKGMKTPEHIVSLRKVSELKGIFEEEGVLMIKAMTTVSDLKESPLLTGNYAVLKIVSKNIATTQVRNMATIGGNLTCRYTWTEFPAVMVALGANMHFMDKEGCEEILPAEEFFKNNAKTNKIFTHVSIPKNGSVTVSYQRIKKTPYIDIPLLTFLLASRLIDGNFSETRVVVNNGVDFVRRDNVLENFLNDKKYSDSLVQEALINCDTAIYETRSTEYKKHMFKVVIRKSMEAVGRKS